MRLKGLNMNKKGIAQNILVLIIVVIILLAGLAGTLIYFMTRPAPPSGEVAVITGVVKDSATNATIAGATVTAGGYTATSGPNGVYSLAVPVGTYTLTVTITDYQTYTTSVSATAAQTYTVNALITKSPLPTPAFVTQNKLVEEGGATYQWLDPHVSYYQYDYWIIWHSVETLMWYNQSSATDLIPWLAESWTMVNETTYDFPLRQGITFQNGAPFNATAVWFSLNRLLIMDASNPNGEHGSQAAWMVQQLVDPDGELFTAMGADPSFNESWVQAVLDLNFVEIMDNYEIRLNLKTPTSQLLAILAGTWAGIVSPSETIKKDYEFHGWSYATEQQPLNYTKYFIHMAGVGDTYFNLPETGWTFGTGPYYVDSVSATTYKIVMKAYANYWGGPNNINKPPTGKQRIQTLEFVYQPSFATRLLDLKQGTATAIGVAEADIFSVVDRDTWINQGVLQSILSGVTVHGVYPTLNTWWLDFCTNITNADGSFKSWQPFSDWRFRMAVACSINMTYISIFVNNRLSLLANNIIPPGTFPEGSYNTNVKPIFSYNLTKARELLLDAYQHPLNSTAYNMNYYNGTQIPAGVVDNSFGPGPKAKAVELYVQSGATTYIQTLTTMVENLNAITYNITGAKTALQFRVVIVPGGQQYTLASKHQIDSYMGGWIADYNHVIDWLMPMYYSRGTYPSWNRWNDTTLDDLYQQAVQADKEGNFTKLIEINNQMNILGNQLLLYMVWWHDTDYFVRSSWLKGWYLNPVYGVDLWSNMYYEQP
jgi:ABC-type transport system substrate-binding protein